MTDNIAKRWRELNGQDNWKGLLNPLDIDLRKNIIHCGEMAAATLDAFNNEKASKYQGCTRYAKRDFFSKVGLEKGNPYKYHVTKFIYATSQFQVPLIVKPLLGDAWDTESNWMGYVAVATDEGKVALGRRDIIIAWRGTVRDVEWIKDFTFTWASASDMLGGSNTKIHQGWKSVYTSNNPQSAYNKSSARDQVLDEVKRLLEEFKTEELSITVVGHSMGAALATLNATDIVANHLNKANNQTYPVTAFAYASPRVGDSNFNNLFSSLESSNLRVLHVSNALDIVPDYPSMLFGYFHIGSDLPIDTTKSPYTKSLLNWHDLELYLHGVAGTQGSNGGFKLEVERHIALVNKWGNALKDEYHVPVTWWVEKNKGMVQKDDGSWELMDHEVDVDA